MNYANNSKLARANDEGREGYGLLGLALLISLVIWYMIGLVLWRAFVVLF